MTIHAIIPNSHENTPRVHDFQSRIRVMAHVTTSEAGGAIVSKKKGDGIPIGGASLHINVDFQIPVASQEALAAAKKVQSVCLAWDTPDGQVSVAAKYATIADRDAAIRRLSTLSREELLEHLERSQSSLLMIAQDAAIVAESLLAIDDKNRRLAALLEQGRRGD